jgi:hypothetical protein
MNEFHTGWLSERVDACAQTVDGEGQESHAGAAAAAGVAEAGVVEEGSQQRRRRGTKRGSGKN